MRTITAFVICSILLVGPVLACKAAGAEENQKCFLIVTEHWPQSTKSDEKAMAKARHRVMKELGILLDAAYKNGNYVRDPTSFPVHDLDFRDDHIVVYFRTSCARGQLFLGELLGAYRQRLTAEQRAIGPELVMESRPATKYEARCGVGATAKTCPLN